LKAWEAARNALENVLDTEAGESIVIVCDQEKREIGQASGVCRRSLGVGALDSPHNTGN